MLIEISVTERQTNMQNISEHISLLCFIVCKDTYFKQLFKKVLSVKHKKFKLVFLLIVRMVCSIHVNSSDMPKDHCYL
jgi:hypothetical protein